MPGGVFLVGRGPYLELHGPLRVVAWDVEEHSWFITLAGRIPPSYKATQPGGFVHPLRAATQPPGSGSSRCPGSTEGYWTGVILSIHELPRRGLVGNRASRIVRSL
jgi:hypothetical protein